MGRAPCCDKANVKKGPWSPEEDAKLKAYIDQHGTGGNWITLPQKIGLKRCGKSCRLRWLNYLRPNIKHGGFSDEEDNIICSLYLSIGSRWSIIAAQLPGRTDNDIKNYWNTRLKKKLMGKQRKERQARRASSLKEEMRRESEIFMVSQTMNPIHYMPELTMPIQTENPSPKDHLQDHTSVSSLGANYTQFSTNFEYPFHLSPTQDQVYSNSVNTFASSTSGNSMNGTYCELPTTHHDVVIGAEPNMFQGLKTYPDELCEMVHSIPQRELDGLENFPKVEMVNCSNGTSSAECSCWGHNSSVLHPPLINYNQSCQELRCWDTIVSL